MSEITENTVKRVALGFLKSFYKNRPRSGETEISSDMRGQGGIIADGYLAFRKKNGDMFTATFEASSRATREEVFYRLQRHLLSWDSLAASGITLALIIGIIQAREIYLLKEVGISGSVALLTGAWFLLFFLFFFSLKGMRRYRYIYAIEQFKEYHADDQWIALAEDVFTEADDQYYRELRRSCIHFGFGLLVVNQKENAQLVFSPSRTDLFENQRDRVKFLSLPEFTSRKDRSKDGNWWRKALRSLRRGFTNRGSYKYSRSYHYQVAISLLSALIMGALLYQQRDELPVRIVDEAEYRKKMEEKLREVEREPLYFMIDTPHLQPYLRQIRPYLEVAQVESVETTSREESYPGVIIPDEGEGFITYDCQRLRGTDSPKYLLEEGIYPDAPAARKRLTQLRQEGFEAGAIWLGCMAGLERGYLVFFDLFIEKLERAQLEAVAHQQKLEQKGWKGRVRIRTVEL
ncbi:MAG: hypothetical protein R3350_03685 [Saprospiraceae bacterium]|nr:hypothetical protein [Saprospiraceae bacterium]